VDGVLSLFIEYYDKFGKEYGVLASVKVGRRPIKSIESLEEVCFSLIGSGKRTSKRLGVYLVARAGRYNSKRGEPLVQFMSKWLGYADKCRYMMQAYRIKPLYRDGAWLRGIFPASFNYRTLQFYYAIMLLMAAKAVSRKRLPKDFRSVRAAYYFEKWLRRDARKILPAELYSNFRRRLILDITNTERDARINSYLVEKGKWPDEKTISNY